MVNNSSISRELPIVNECCMLVDKLSSTNIAENYPNFYIVIKTTEKDLKYHEMKCKVKNALLFTLQRGKLNSEKKQKGVCNHE